MIKHSIAILLTSLMFYGGGVMGGTITCTFNDGSTWKCNCDACPDEGGMCTASTIYGEPCTDECCTETNPPDPPETQAFNFTLSSSTGTITSEDSSEGSSEGSSVCVVPSEGLSEGSSACADPSEGCSVNGTGDTQTLNYNNCGDTTSDTYTVTWTDNYQANISYPDDMPPTVTNDDDCTFIVNTDSTGILTVTEDSTCNIVINNSDYGDGMLPCPITLTGSANSCNVNATIQPQDCGSPLSSTITLTGCKLTVSYFGQKDVSEQPCNNVTASTPKDLINKIKDEQSCNAWPDTDPPYTDPPCQTPPTSD
jgi:hypothetical protein